MRPLTLQALTWTTVAAAVASAMWLAASEAEHGFDLRLARPAAPGAAADWPSEPTAAGPPPQRRADTPTAPQPPASR